MLEIHTKLKPQLEKITGRRRLQSTRLRLEAVKLHCVQELHFALLQILELRRKLFLGVLQERAHLFFERLQIFRTRSIYHFLSFTFTS